MKKIIGLIIVLIAVFVGLTFYGNKVKSDVNADILSALNGYPIINSSMNDKVEDTLVKYQNNNFVANDSFIVLCDDVEGFKEFEETAKEIEKLLAEDPFCVVENMDIYDEEAMEKYSCYYDYNSEDDFKDSRVKEVDNQYIIYVRDLKFGRDGWDVVKYGKFKNSVSQKEASKPTFEQMQAKNCIVEVGQTQDGLETYYVYYNQETNKTIEFVMKSIFGFVISFNKG